MSVPAIHCEVRKAAYRQSKDGLVVSFVIHPNEMPPALATSPLGTRYMLALAEIGDEEQPVAPASPARPNEALERPSAGAAGSSGRSEAARERYQTSDEMAKACARAGILGNDQAFQIWAWNKYGRNQGPFKEASAKVAVQCIRDLCGVTSRSEIASDPNAYERFLFLEQEYKMATGQAAEARG